MNGSERIAAERRWQVEREGWTPEHDDEHDQGELVWAARAYAAVYNMPTTMTASQHTADQVGWPWDVSWWKPSDNPIRNLEKAGALIAAEIDRLLRKRDADLEQKLDDMGVQ